MQYDRLLKLIRNAAMLGVLAAAPAEVAPDELPKDPVLAFYRQRAEATFHSRHPLERAVGFCLRATATYHELTSTGQPKDTDLAIAEFYYSYGHLDSQKTIVAGSGRLGEWDIWYPSVFVDTYRFQFYPNDNGGPFLAIGFEPDSASKDLPFGLAAIDHDRHFLRELYLHYPHKEDYKRFSQVITLSLVDGYVFPDTIVEVGARMGILVPEYYRKRTVISNIRISR